MTIQADDWAWDIGAAGTRAPLPSRSRSDTATGPWDKRPVAGDQTRFGIAVQPTWLRELHVVERLPEDVQILFTGCGSSYHAAQTAGSAIQAFELVLGRGTKADILVCVSHEGGTEMTLAAA